MACFNDPTPQESLWVVGWMVVADRKNLDQLWELDQNSGSWINILSPKKPGQCPSNGRPHEGAGDGRYHRGAGGPRNHGKGNFGQVGPSESVKENCDKRFSKNSAKLKGCNCTAVAQTK